MEYGDGDRQLPGEVEKSDLVTDENTSEFRTGKKYLSRELEISQQ